MMTILLQTVVPFAISAVIVVIITFIAERYGTKVGGILGTLPSTIVVAFLFIALTNSISFAAKSAIVVPAEMGINLIFLFMFSLLCKRSFAAAIIGSLSIWTILSTMLFFSNLSSLPVAFLVFLLCFTTTFLLSEHRYKIPSSGRRNVKYTALKLMMRGVIAGSVIALSVVLSNVSAILSGIFSVFPAIFLSTMIISYREHGPDFTGGFAKSMIFGTPSVTSYAISIHYLYPAIGIVLGSIGGYLIGIMVTISLFSLRSKIR